MTKIASTEKWLNLPNTITAVRMTIAPLVLWLLLTHPDKTDPIRWLSVLLFVAAISTDGLDGRIARSRGQVTNLGKLLDPIADKFLIGAALIGLSALGEVPWLITGLILVREVGITFYRFTVLRSRDISANAGGKLKTILQGITLGFLVAPIDYYLPFLKPLEIIALYLTLTVTLWTGLAYLVEAFRQSRKS
jgi:CDP-diacylglycerol---glycerol-3-phosphate 3-phosphatidyltransferase